jgi:hypothetical protein
MELMIGVVVIARKMMMSIDNFNYNKTKNNRENNNSKSKSNNNNNDNNNNDNNKMLICAEVGTLLCCDFCVKAFHFSCVGMNEDSLHDDEKWRCIECEQQHDRAEKEKEQRESIQEKIMQMNAARLKKELIERGVELDG